MSSLAKLGILTLVVLISLLTTLFEDVLSPDDYDEPAKTQSPQPSRSKPTASQPDEVITREFGGPAAAIGSTAEFKDHTGTATIRVDQAEWVEDGGATGIEAYKYLAIRLTINCTQGSCDLYSSAASFRGSDHGNYQSAFQPELPDEYTPELTNISLKTGESFTGWLIMAAVEQAGTLTIYPYQSSDYPSVRFAIPGPSVPEPAEPANPLNITIEDGNPDGNFQMRLIGYELVDNSSWERPAEGYELLKLKIGYTGSGPKSAWVYSRYSFTVFQDSAEIKAEPSSSTVYPLITEASIENGDIITGYLLYPVDPAKPVTIKYLTFASSSPLELVTFQP